MANANWQKRRRSRSMKSRTWQPHGEIWHWKLVVGLAVVSSTSRLHSCSYERNQLISCIRLSMYVLSYPPLNFGKCSCGCLVHSPFMSISFLFPFFFFLSAFSAQVKARHSNQDCRLAERLYGQFSHPSPFRSSSSGDLQFMVRDLAPAKPSIVWPVKIFAISLPLPPYQRFWRRENTLSKIKQSDCPRPRFPLTFTHRDEVWLWQVDVLSQVLTV